MCEIERCCNEILAMKLSFCIPTYNRASFLEKNLNIIVNQIEELSAENDVEILVMDNASSDNTAAVCRSIMDIHKAINIEYHVHHTNLGADRNFISAMKLAHGKYSILWGDDDYLIDGALKKILKLIESGHSLYLSNRKCIDTEGNFICEQQFIDIPHANKVFYYNNEDSIRSHFYGITTMGGALSFISSVIYKTVILNKFEFDDRVIGSNYAFLFYWWNELLSGGTLYYLNESYVLATTSGSTNNNYGDKVDRVLVDYVGFSTIAKIVFTNSPYKNDFLKIVDKDHPDLLLRNLYFNDRKKFVTKLYIALTNAGWSNLRLDSFKESVSLTRILKNIIKGFILP